ncbi:MAG: hypothetical protein SH850_02700 [Planctomycetaceae bacterium]|nr:hypothetical protein [Planctomycetaceae bacterium]
MLAVAFRTLDRSCVLLGIAVFLTGCGGGASDAPKTVPAKGVVTYKGQPVPKLSVGFTPIAEGKLASGATDAAGKFALTTNKPGDGAMVGTYKVAVSFVPDEIPEMPGFPGSEKKVESPIPVKYADAATSGLTFTVDKDAAKNDFKIELTD